MKERYEKPVMRPAEQANGLLREKYQTPDMEVVDLGLSTVIATQIVPIATVSKFIKLEEALTTTAYADEEEPIDEPDITVTATATVTSPVLVSDRIKLS